MEIPKYHETFIPVLEILFLEESLHSRELGSRIREKYYSKLPLDLLGKKTSSGANVLLDRIGWGKSYLKMAKFVSYPKRGMVQITDKGKKVLQKGTLSLAELQSDRDFIEYRLSAKAKKENELVEETISVENASP
jgi:restriction system protein